MSSGRRATSSKAKGKPATKRKRTPAAAAAAAGERVSDAQIESGVSARIARQSRAN